jgi:hypothetical protein
MNLKETALLAQSEFQAKQSEAKRQQLTTNAETTAKMIYDRFGFTAQANPENGTATIEGLTFKVRSEHGDQRLVVKGACQNCQREAWIGTYSLAEIGKVIENDFMGYDSRHHCPTESSEKTVSLEDMIREIVRDELENH